MAKDRLGVRFDCCLVVFLRAVALAKVDVVCFVAGVCSEDCAAEAPEPHPGAPGHREDCHLCHHSVPPRQAGQWVRPKISSPGGTFLTGYHDLLVCCSSRNVCLPY